MSENFTKIWIKFFLSSNQTFLIINISFLTFSPELDDDDQARIGTSCHHLADELDREHSPVSSSPPVLEMTPELEKCRLCYFVGLAVDITKPAREIPLGVEKN